MFAVRALISQLSNKAAHALPYALGHRTPIALELPMADLGLLAPNIAGYLYQEGSSERQATPPDFWKPLKTLGDAWITHQLVANAANLYYGLGVAWMAYQMGKAESWSDRIAAGLKTLVMFPMGYLGVQLGLGYSDVLEIRNAKRTQNLIASVSETLGGVENEALQNSLQQLKAQAHAYTRFVKKSLPGQKPGHYLKQLLWEEKPYLAKMNKLIKGMAQSQDHFLAQWGELAKGALQELPDCAQRALKHLHQEVGLMKNLRFLRLFNPALGYMLTTCLIAPVLTNTVLRLFTPRAQPVTYGDDDARLALTPVLEFFKPAAGARAPGGGH